MRAKTSHSNKHFQLRKISFNGILNSEYFFHRSGPIKLALNKNRIMKKNYYVVKTRPKLDQGRITRRTESKESEELNISDEYSKDKTRIPSDLNKVILKYGRKFRKQNERFHELKEDNDAFMGHWHYINDLDEKKERKLMLEKYFNDKNKNSINFYTSEVKKMCEDMFRISPLLTNRYLDIFFYYLKEFNKNYEDKKKMAYIKQKMIKFMEKLKDLLDFVEVMKDTGLDSITKDIRMKNSGYNKEYEKRVAIEKIKDKINQRKEDKKSIQESKTMIKKTNKTLFYLEKNKNILDDDISPLDINSKIEKYRKFLSPNKTPYSTQSKFHIISDNKNSKMNSTASTAFYLSGKGFFSKKNNKKIFSGLKDRNELKEENNIHSPINNINKYIFYKIKPKKLSMNRYSPLKMESKEKINKLHSMIEKRISFKNFDNKFINKNLTARKEDFISNINKNQFKNLTKNMTSTNIIDTSKREKLKYHLFSNLKEPSSKTIKEISKDTYLIAKKVAFKNKSKTSYDSNSKLAKQNDNSKNGLINMKKVLNKSKSQLMSLYEDIKNRKKMKQKDNDDLKNYFVKKGKSVEPMNSLKSVYTMDIIKQAKIIIDKMDIEQRTKKVFQAYLTYEQTKKLESIKDINKKVKALDIEFIKQIIKYKSDKNV